MIRIDGHLMFQGVEPEPDDSGIYEQVEHIISIGQHKAARNARYQLSHEEMEIFRSFGGDLAIERAYFFGLCRGAHYRSQAHKRNKAAKRERKTDDGRNN